MFKRELPLMFPDDPDVRRVAERTFDPFEYLMLRHAEGRLATDFRSSLGKVAYHVPCHLRVQNIGLKTRDVLGLVPGTTLTTIERCSGHDGTYAVKSEFHEVSMKIARPVVQRVEAAAADHFASDCPMAGHQIGAGLGKGPRAGAPDPPVAKSLWHLRRAAWTVRSTGALNEADLMSLEQYARSREAFRASVIAHKRARTVPVGPNMTWVFEDRLTIQYQVQEMLRIERIFEPRGIREELDAYNPLIPDGSNWKATMMIEYPDPARTRRGACRPARGRGSMLCRGRRHGRVLAIADEDLARENEREDLGRALAALRIATSHARSDPPGRSDHGGHRSSRLPPRDGAAGGKRPGARRDLA